MLLIGGVLSIFTSIASLAPMIGILAYVFMSSYFCATYFKIIESTAVGDSDAPSFPETSNILEDLVWPMFKIIYIAVCCFSPYILSLYLYSSSSILTDLIFYVCLAYFPMAVLAVTVLGYLSAMLPTIVLPSIIKAGWIYWFAVILLGLIYTLEDFLSEFLDGFSILHFVIMGFVAMYVLMTSGRILGLVYRNREEELEWI